MTKEGSGASCSAYSSLYGYPCENVLDGELTTEWKSNEDADSGAWIQVKKAVIQSTTLARRAIFT